MNCWHKIFENKENNIMREGSNKPDRNKNGREIDNKKEEGYQPNNNPRANENIPDSQLSNDQHDVGAEITDGEAS